MVEVIKRDPAFITTTEFAAAVGELEGKVSKLSGKPQTPKLASEDSSQEGEDNSDGGAPFC